MSSSSTSSNAESEPIKGKPKTATAAKSKVQEDSSDSDFVSTKKHAKEKASPKQGAASSKDLSSTRFSFQKMLMNSNNKFTELLKSKQSVAELSPKSNKNKPANASQDSSQEFSPIASSTQIISSQYSSSVKQLKKQREEALSSSESEPELRKQRAKQNKQIIEKKKNHSESNSESESDDGKRKRDKQQKSKVKKLKKDKNSESDSSDKSTKKTLTKTKTHKRSSSSDSSSSQEKHSSSRISSNKTVLEKVRNNISSRSDSDYQQKSKPKLAKHVKKSATETTQISAKTRLFPPESSSEDSSASEEEPTRKPKPAHKSHKQASSSDSEDANVKSASKSKVQLRKFEEGDESISRVKEQLDRIKNLIVKKDIFLVQIPKSLDPNTLVGTKISLSETVRVPEKSRKYDCIPSDAAQEPVAVSFNADSVDVIKPAGSIKMQRHLKSTRIPDFAGSANNQVAFPNDLKERHPLFGADYTDKINLEEHIKQKLKAAVESHTKKKKKKKHKNKDVEKGSEVQEEEIFKFLSQTLPPAEKEKRKSKDLAGNENSVEIEPETKSKKKKKKNKEIDITDELKVDTSHTESIELKKKHKHKKREKSLMEEVDSEVYKNTIIDDEIGKKLLNEEDVETDSPKKKKKKHKKEHKSDDSFNLIGEMLFSKNLEMSTSKKKKKKYE